METGPGRRGVGRSSIRALNQASRTTTKPATNIFLGRFFGESLILAETGYVNRAIQIGGTAEITQLPFFIAACDYAIIGEELFAVSAYMSREPRLLSSIKAADWIKVGIIAIVALTTVGGVVAWGMAPLDGPAAWFAARALELVHLLASGESGRDVKQTVPLLLTFLLGTLVLVRSALGGDPVEERPPRWRRAGSERQTRETPAAHGIVPVERQRRGQQPFEVDRGRRRSEVGQRLLEHLLGDREPRSRTRVVPVHRRDREREAVVADRDLVIGDQGEELGARPAAPGADRVRVGAGGERSRLAAEEHARVISRSP